MFQLLEAVINFSKISLSAISSFSHQHQKDFNLIHIHATDL
jgi:hypothetical protein